MADFPFETLLEPRSDDQPCGPDLEFEGDAEFMGFTARIEGVLPQSFFSFDRGSIDFPAEFKAITALSSRSVDLRLLVPLAKLSILNRDIEGFEKAVTAIHTLLRERWESVNPQLLDGDPIMRVITLQTLDDLPHTVFPLQAVTLFRTRRFGAVSYRACLLAEGKIPPRRGAGEGGEDEKTPSQSDIRTAIQEAEISDLVAARDRAGRLFEAIKGIEQAIDDLSGQIGALRFEQLKPQLGGLFEYLDSCCSLRDPSLGTLAPKSEDEEGGGPSRARDGAAAPAAAGSIETAAEVQEALRAAITYFFRHERSSPIRFLLAQAHSLAGKSFYDALQALVPDHASYASLRLARDLPFQLPVERLSYLLSEAEAGIELEAPIEEERAEDEAPAEDMDAQNSSGEAESSSSSDSWGSWDSADETSASPEAAAEENVTDENADASEAAASADEGAASSDSWGNWESGGEDAAEAEAQQPPRESAPQREGKPRKMFVARTRLEALDLIERIAAYFRMTEPSSPIPLLLDQARGNAGRDFLGLLRETLPERVFRVDE